MRGARLDIFHPSAVTIHDRGRPRNALSESNGAIVSCKFGTLAPADMQTVDKSPRGHSSDMSVSACQSARRTIKHAARQAGRGWLAARGRASAGA